MDMSVLFFVQNAIKKKVKSIGSSDKRDHWMDYAKEDYGVSCLSVSGVMAVTVIDVLVAEYNSITWIWSQKMLQGWLLSSTRKEASLK